MPMLARVNTWRPATGKGTSSAARTRLATAVAWAEPSRSSSSTPNSSPPSRATVSPGRTQRPSRAPTAARSRSPAAWPRLSLTTLKSSRSMNKTPVRSPVRRARSRAWSTRSLNSRRLASPVSGSWNAWWESCPSRAVSSSIFSSSVWVSRWFSRMVRRWRRRPSATVTMVTTVRKSSPGSPCTSMTTRTTTARQATVMGTRARRHDADWSRRTTVSWLSSSSATCG